MLATRLGGKMSRPEPGISRSPVENVGLLMGTPYLGTFLNTRKVAYNVFVEFIGDSIGRTHQARRDGANGANGANGMHHLFKEGDV